MSHKSTLRYSLLGTGLLILTAGIVWGTSQLHETLIKKRLEQVAKDWEEIRVGTWNYGMDRCGMYFPADTQKQWKFDPDTPLTFGGMDTTRNWDGFTTPLAYIKKEPLYDPFRNGKQMYGYTCWTMHHVGANFFILHSPGPDKITQLSLDQFRKWMEPYQTVRIPEQDDWSRLSEPERAMLRDYVTPYCYDPSNGLTSKGDLIQIMDYWGNNDTTHIFGFGYKNWYQYPSLKNPSLYDSTTARLPLDYYWDQRVHKLTVEMPTPKTIQLPLWFIQQMESAGINLNPSKEEAVKQNFQLQEISQSYFGALHRAILESRALDEGESGKLWDLKRRHPEWWNAVSKPIISGKNYETRTYSKDSVIIPFTLYLESQFILMGDASHKKDDKAFKEISSRYSQLFSNYTEHNSYYSYYDSLQKRMKKNTTRSTHK